MENEINPKIVEKSEKGSALLQKAYDFVLNGVPMVSEPLSELVAPYIGHYKNTETAIAQFILNQKLKCSSAGFVTGLGGVLTLPVTIPLDLASSLYIELRMIAGIAMIRGYDIHDDQVKTLVYMCLVFNAVGDVMKQVGMQVIEKVAVKKLLPKLTKEMIVKINKVVGFRFLAKAGSKAPVKIIKIIPLLGGVVGAACNWAEVAICAKAAKKMFNEDK